MQYVLKIYPNQMSSTPSAQVLNVNDIEINDDVGGISSCKITLPPNVAGMAQYRKAEIYEVANGVDTLVFLGYVANVTPAVDSLVLDCKSEKGLLGKKKVVTDRVFVASTASDIIKQILNDWNAAYGDDWQVDSDSLATSDKTVAVGDTIYDIIDELATNLGAVWESTGRIIKIRTLLGTDYTDPANFKELVYDPNNPRGNNISGITYQSYETISNVIIGSDGTTKNVQYDSVSIAEFGALAEMVSFRPGNLATYVANYLTSKKVAQFSYNIVPDWAKFQAEAGDQVQMRVENVSEYFNFTGSVIVNTKKTTIQNGTKICTYGVSDTYVYFESFINRFLKVESDLNLNIVR